MNDCCPAPSAEMLKRDAEEKKILATPIQIEGVNLTIGDLFPSAWDAQSFYGKVQLIKKAKGGSGDKVDVASASMFGGDSEPDEGEMA